MTFPEIDTPVMLILVQVEHILVHSDAWHLATMQSKHLEGKRYKPSHIGEAGGSPPW